MQQTLIDVITDPFVGPYYGEDYFIDSDGVIQVNDIKTAALIMRKVNLSMQFNTKLVRLGTSGDVVSLGFDQLASAEPVFSTTVGPNKLPIDVKANESGKFCLYVDGKRSVKMFAKMSAVKKYIKQLDKELFQVAVNTDDEFEND